MHYHFEGVLTAQDVKRCISHSFDAPANSGQLDIHLSFAPARINGLKNMLCLSLFDPAGFRGAGHRGGDTHGVCITPDQATPGYWPGAIPVGRWTIEIDTHMILPDEPCRYELKVALSPEGTQPAGASWPASMATATPPVKDGPGWYRGDLHTHTIHSDGRQDVAGLLKTAQAYGLDFLALTDHNTVTGLAELNRLSPPGLLTLAGMELTTYWGHAVCLGTRQWIDWRVGTGGRTMAETARSVSANNQVFIIAHPCAIGDPLCTGCKWVYEDVKPGPARLVEVWNGIWHGEEENNEEALAMWYEWLNQGYRLVATAGSDTHDPDKYARGPGFNVIYADALSEGALLQALRSGHLYLSAGPHLTFTGHTADGQQAMMGDSLTGQTATLICNWDACPGDARLRVIADGQPIKEWEAGGSGSQTWSLSSQQAHWCVVEVRNAKEDMLALTNPIFLADDSVS